MSDRPEVTVEILIEHWRRQGRKLTDAGVPLERVVASLREATLQAEKEWFMGIVEEAKERLAAVSPHKADDQEEDPPADLAAGELPQGPVISAGRG